LDCAAGFSNWEKGWSPLKQEYCCKHEGKACNPSTTTKCPPQDCNLGYSNWQAGWSPKKRDYCCKHEGKACPTTTPDCNYQFNNWEAKWAQKKKDWCCLHENRGCSFISEAESGTGLLLAKPSKATEKAEGGGQTVAVVTMMLPGALLFVALMGIARLRWMVAGSGPELTRKLQTEEADNAREFQQCPQEADGEEEE
jgi:hypothetical protein